MEWRWTHWAASIPITLESKKAGDNWDPSVDYLGVPLIDEDVPRR